MKIVIAGGSGFLGRPLASALSREGHEIVILTRQASTKAEPPVRSVTWSPDGRLGPWAADIKGAGAIVNLAGESIAAKRWTGSQKTRIFESRVLATRSLVAAIAATDTRPPVFVSGSAVGYYGPLGDEVATEERTPGADFLATVCQAWEAEAMQAAQATRVTCIRTGLVLARDGGALPKMLPPFWFGAGGPVGSGRQYWPWVHRKDWVDLVRWTIQTAGVSGPVNATSPKPVTNAVFAKALGRALRRPALLQPLVSPSNFSLVKWPSRCCFRDSARSPRRQNVSGSGSRTKIWTKRSARSCREARLISKRPPRRWPSCLRGY